MKGEDSSATSGDGAAIAAYRVIISCLDPPQKDWLRASYAFKVYKNARNAGKKMSSLLLIHSSNK